MWQKVKTGSKTGFQKAYKTIDKLGPPVNRLSNKLGSEAFWPTSLDKESDKAARILKSFCKDGFYTEEDIQPVDGPKQKQRVLQKIPEKVIQNAKALAICTTMRTGLWMGGAGGSGVIVARLPDGSWSPPSGIHIQTLGIGFLVGIDIYDCVMVINTEAALKAFTTVRCTLGGDISVTAGPFGAGGVLDTELHKRQSPIYTYMKSRGFYAGISFDGTVIIERMDENERFYLEKLPAQDILAGKVRHPPYEIKRLMETIKAAQGDSDYDADMLPDEPPPGDYEIEDDGQTFGIPDKEDPDPYGVLALEKEGMSLKEAGTKKRASWEEFTFNPAASSPVHSIYARQSIDQSARSTSRRNSWRTSAFSSYNEPKTPSSLRNSMDQSRTPAVMSDSSTQTDFPEAPSSPGLKAGRTSSLHSSKGSLSNGHQTQIQDIPEHDVLKPEQREPVLGSATMTPPRTPPAIQESHHEDTDADDEDDHDDDDVQIVEAPVVHSIQTVQPVASQTNSKARIVQVAKRLPPALPPRNPSRQGGSPIAPTPQSTGSDSSGSLDLPRSASPRKELEVGSPLKNSFAASAEPEEAHAKENTDEAKPKDNTKEPEVLPKRDVEVSATVEESGLGKAEIDTTTLKMDEIRLEDNTRESQLSRDSHGVQQPDSETKMPGGFD